MGRNFVVLFFWGILIVLVAGCARKNVGNTGDGFPAYEQIRADPSHMNDFVIPQTAQNDFLPRISSYPVIKRLKYFGAFDFPADSVVYFLNGRQVKSKKKAEKELKERAGRIERVSIGEAGPDGKREIEIAYEAVSNRD